MTGEAAAPPGRPAAGAAPRGVLRLVLGDQISDARLSSLRDLDPARDVVLMAEVMSEASYVRHHKQKFALVFSGLRQFAERLREAGAVVRYVRLDDPGNTQTLGGEVLRALEGQPFARVVVTEPGEWRLLQAFDELALASPVPVEVRPDDRFICSRAEFERWAASGRSSAWSSSTARCAGRRAC